MSQEKNITGDERTADCACRKPYDPPLLRRCGSLTELTRGGTEPGGDTQLLGSGVT